MRVIWIAVAAAVACGSPLDVELLVVDVSGDVAVSPTEPGLFRITVSNPGGERVVWGMGSSSCQLTLYVLREGDERLAVDSRVCTEDLSELGLDPGASRTEEITWGGEVILGGTQVTLEPGTYRLVAAAGTTGESEKLQVTVRAPAAPAAALAAAKTRWDAAGPATYRLTLVRECECLPTAIGPVEIVVRDRVIESLTYAGTGELVDDTYAPLFPAVDGLFDVIEDALGAGAARLVAAYHPTLGYPERVAIDYDAGYADDEITYVIGEFEAR